MPNYQAKWTQTIVVEYATYEPIVAANKKEALKLIKENRHGVWYMDENCLAETEPYNITIVKDENDV